MHLELAAVSEWLSVRLNLTMLQYNTQLLVCWRYGNRPGVVMLRKRFMKEKHNKNNERRRRQMQSSVMRRHRGRRRRRNAVGCSLLPQTDGPEGEEHEERPEYKTLQRQVQLIKPPRGSLGTNVLP
ncbi:hypothetical protein F2P81_017888 [Scophthalmus maximus]|uniref:Uncharacterized protein n=1 Tax=Scophthalmus maximus TaxID=52904 RepID=A0A6A4S350_SCOMX|nr:hypothetical protein F2P81_017888 [Scophthalmus maximus]